MDKYIRSGKLKAIKIESLVRIEAKSVYRFIKDNPLNCLHYLQ